jgi:hypothetical protein
MRLSSAYTGHTRQGRRCFHVNGPALSRSKHIVDEETRNRIFRDEQALALSVPLSCQRHDQGDAAIL